jgi:hypothetical protein
MFGIGDIHIRPGCQQPGSSCNIRSEEVYETLRGPAGGAKRYGLVREYM